MIAALPAHLPRGRSFIRAALAAGAAAVLLVIGAGSASAHTTFLGVDPADGVLLTAAPAAITLTFNEPVQVRDGGIRLLDAAGTEQPVTAQTINSTVVITPTGLGTGTFIVAWRVISADSHPISGGSTFSIETRSTQVVAAPSVDPDPVQWVAAGAQAFTYLGVLGAAGLTAFELLVLRGRPAPGHALRRRTAGALAAAGVLGAVLVVPLTALRQSGASLTGMVDPDSWIDDPTDGPWLSALLIAAGSAGCWWNAWRGAHPPGAARSAAGMAGAGVTLGALALVGHTRAFGPPVLVLTADLLHVTVAAFWFGGLIALTITLTAARRASTQLAAGTGHLVTVTSGSGSPGPPVASPDAVETRPDPSPHPGSPIESGSIAVVLQRFSTIAAALVAILGVTGVILGWRVLGSFEALFGTPYGIALLIKLAVVIPVLGIAGWNRYRLLPAVLGAPDDPAGWLRIGTAIKLEAALLMAILAVTGVLVNSNPVLSTPNPTTGSTTPGGPPIEQHHPLGGGSAAIVLTPGAVGVNSLEFQITDAQGAAVEPFADPSVRVSMPAADIGPLIRPATRTGPGRYQAAVDLPLAGDWVIEIGARTSQFESPAVEFPVQIR